MVCPHSALSKSSDPRTLDSTMPPFPDLPPWAWPVLFAVGLVAALTTLKGSIGDFLAAVGTKIGAAIPQ